MCNYMYLHVGTVLVCIQLQLEALSDAASVAPVAKQTSTSWWSWFFGAVDESDDEDADEEFFDAVSDPSAFVYSERTLTLLQ